MRQALYRQYRPKTLADVVGQDYIKVTLGNQLASGQVGHAYLFSGPKGTGKTSVARILARSVNCLNLTNGEACGKCAMCVAFDNNQMMDLIEIDAASNRSIDSIRDLIAKISLAPSQGKYKIYVIDEAHQLTKDASNALLKTLEEPPAHAIFVLATTEPDKLLPTIVSRCQRFDFRYIPMDEVVKYLAEVAKAEKIKISQDGLEFIARQSGGGMRDAMSLLEQASFIEGEITQEKLAEWLGFVDWQTVFELTSGVIGGDIKTVLQKIDELYHKGYDLNRLTVSWILLTRQILAVKLGNGDKLPVTKEQVKSLGGLADTLSTANIVKILQELMWAGKELKTAVVPQTPLEIAVVKLAEQVSLSDGNNNVAPPWPGRRSLGDSSSSSQGVSPTNGGDTSENKPKPEERETVAPSSISLSEVSKAVGVSSISLAEIQGIWPKVLEQMRTLSPTLTASLMKAQIGVEAGAVVVKFAQRFYKEKLEQPNSMGLLNRAFNEVGYDCRIICAVEEVPKEQPVDLQNVSEVFGGTV